MAIVHFAENILAALTQLRVAQKIVRVIISK